MQRKVKPLKQRLRRIRLLALDVDGVLTDGSILLDPRGGEWKTFDVKDGLAIAQAVKGKLEVAFLTGRSSRAVAQRAKELGVSHCFQQCKNKGAALERLKKKMKLARDQVAYVGDDLNDLPAFGACGLRVAVADAAKEVRQQADFITRSRGGQGAAREVIERILRSNGAWGLGIDGMK